MRERLPIDMENLTLPIDEFAKKEQPSNNYGFVSILYIISLMITLGSVITLIVIWS